MTTRRIWDAQANGTNDRHQRVPDHGRECYRRLDRAMRDAGVSMIAGTAQEPEKINIVASGKRSDVLLIDVEPLVGITNMRHIAAAIAPSDSWTTEA